MLRKNSNLAPGAGKGPRGMVHLLLLSLALALSGCSLKGMAINGVANALAGGGEEGGSNVYLRDNDPILVGEALPFSLKLMETILQETPEHEGLLVAAATGFVSYAEMWVLRPAQYLEDTDYAASREGRARAKALFLRARDYAGRALEVRHPDIVQKLLRTPETAVRQLEEEDLPAMYWFTAAHGRAISTDLSDASLLVQGSTVSALLEKAMALDETWNRGALHELYMGLPAQLGGSPETAEEHFARAMELNEGTSIGPLVSLAETVHVARQNREEFTRLLNEALAFDPDQYPDTRLTNILAQQHAAWLLSRADRLFWASSDHQTPTAPKNRRLPWLFSL